MNHKHYCDNQTIRIRKCNFSPLIYTSQFMSRVPLPPKLYYTPMKLENSMYWCKESNKQEYDMTTHRLEMDPWFITEHSMLTGRLNKQHVTDWSWPLEKKWNLLTEFEINVISRRVQEDWKLTKWQMERLCSCTAQSHLLSQERCLINKN